MMDPVEAWVDPEEIKRLAKKLTSPAEVTPVAESIPDEVDEGFEGFASPEPVKADGDHQVSDESAEVSSDVVINQEDPVYEDFIRLFEAELYTDGVFLLDRDGDVILENDEFKRFYPIGAAVARSILEDSKRGTHVHLKVSAETYMTILPVESVSGTYVLGMVIPNMLSADDLARVAESVRSFVRRSYD